MSKSWIAPGCIHRSTDPACSCPARSRSVQLRRCCRYVYINPSLSEPGVVRNLESPSRHTTAPRRAKLASIRIALGEITRQLATTVRAARRFGKVHIDAVLNAADRLTTLVLDDPDGCLWLIQMQGSDGLLYRRSIGTAAYAIMFGRQLGLKRAELCHLAAGGLLLDIGKTSVPIQLLAKPGKLNEIEQHFVQRHVLQGINILRLTGDAPPRVAEMILGHHERLDGSGYPRGLRGTEIPLFARIAAIIDSFDAMTLNRHYADGISAHHALRALNTGRGQAYDAALLREFIHALGVYPTGTRVELVDGRVGLVCAQNPEWPLRPLILQTETADGELLTEPRLLASGLDGHIARALPPAPQPVNLEELEQIIPAPA
ncbi:MAG TPA: HD-GYP domain-containing protein [Chromatiales bacterium]|nr:HD-GYP domain-containing protein [Chromatiales bacterium]